MSKYINLITGEVIQAKTERQALQYFKAQHTPIDLQQLRG